MQLPEPRVLAVLRQYLNGEIDVDEAAPQLLHCDLGSGFGLEDVSAAERSRLMALFGRMGMLLQHRPQI